jgi:hypothetical protein
MTLPLSAVLVERYLPVHQVDCGAYIGVIGVESLGPQGWGVFVIHAVLDVPSYREVPRGGARRRRGLSAVLRDVIVYSSNMSVISC